MEGPICLKRFAELKGVRNTLYQDIIKSCLLYFYCKMGGEPFVVGGKDVLTAYRNVTAE